jgi:protein SCO1/2
MTLRAISRVIVVLLVLIVGLAIFAHDQLAHSQPSAALRGTDLGMQAAPAFSLADQAGVPISLAELRGRPVVLTFLSTGDRNVDPATADKLHAAAHSLSARASSVAWVAISADPAADTPAAAQAFVRAHGMDGVLHYLVGSTSQLEPVWSRYGVATGQTTHTAGVFVIDSQGRERVFLDSSFDPATLSGDLRMLLGG